MSIKNDTGSSEPPVQDGTGQWKGLAEIDQAIHENRLTEYRMKKAWADPWIRFGLIVMAGAIAAFAIYVAVDELYY
jgi:hypothetical protein